MMWGLFVVLAVVSTLAGCANQQYAGINYGEVTTPDGENWKIAGGKDETNITFKITKPDGTVVEYHADNADASTVIKTMIEGNTALMTQALNLIKTLTPGATP